MGEIAIDEGSVLLLRNGQPLTLSADEIFTVIFEGADSLRGVEVSRDDFTSTDLEFRAHTHRTPSPGIGSCTGPSRADRNGNLEGHRG